MGNKACRGPRPNAVSRSIFHRFIQNWVSSWLSAGGKIKYTAGKATNMPSILVETGFISNPEEEDYLNSVTGQQELCDAITRAVQHYKTALETNTFQTISPEGQ